MLLIFMPCLYVDTTAVWAFPQKWRKVLVGSAGMMTELFIASLALSAWLVIEPGVLRSVLYNMIFIASVSTVLFNGNPLLRYDAYYILADLIEIPNLRQRSTEYVTYLLKRYVVGERVPSMANPPREKAWFLAYGVLSGIYRCFVVVGIILFIASSLFAVGAAMAVVVAVLWVVVPLVKMLKYLLFGKATRVVRARAVGVSAVVAAAVVLAFGAVPLPVSVRTPCALEPSEQRILRAEWPGFFSQVYVKDGDQVREGQLLAVIDNEELDAGIVRLRQEIEASRARHRLLETEHQAAAQAEAYRLSMLTKDLDLLTARKESLTVRAPFDGQVIGPDLERVRGRFVKLGEPLFAVGSLQKLRVLAVVSDADVAAIRKTGGSEEVRINFRTAPGRVFDGLIDRVHPSATHALPPAALTSAGGGSVLLDPRSPDGERTLLPWYRVDVVFRQRPDTVPVGAAGTARFVVGREPIARQLWLRFRRMLQRRFLL